MKRLIKETITASEVVNTHFKTIEDMIDSILLRINLDDLDYLRKYIYVGLYQDRNDRGLVIGLNNGKIPIIAQYDELEQLYFANVSKDDLRAYLVKRIEEAIIDAYGLDNIASSPNDLINELKKLINPNTRNTITDKTVDRMDKLIPVVIDIAEQLGWTVTKAHKRIMNPYKIWIKNSLYNVVLCIWHNGGYRTSGSHWISLEVEFYIRDN